MADNIHIQVLFRFFFFFSIIGAVRTGCFMLYILSTSGFKQSVCDQSFYNGPISKFWACAFVLSKAPELGEVFILFLME